MTDTSTRLGLPLLQAGQAQKEWSHNEALTLLDMAVQPVVEAVARNTPPSDPVAGACWIVGAAPTGAWTGHAQALAGWSDGGWRFVGAREGMVVWSRADATEARFIGAAWRVGTLAGTQLLLGGVAMLGARQSAIAAPANGTTIDAEARGTLAAVLAALRLHRLIEP
ncbi:DUF2793 domain-containing protein [Sphingomonas sp. RB3P16]|uniref:DUF2793 domain-containing protein n=1 Tax=Parasphingomonas frigoris TaxID=3096163 RepID=UPI002FCB1F55